jgi:acyl carrier protein
LLASQTPERLAQVLEAKLIGALHLDALTRHQDLDAFVLFSSAAGTLGNAGQSTYAAANAGLDALAAQRRKRGQAGVSLAWGLWQPSGTGLTAKLSAADLAHMARQGIAPLSTEQGMQLMDAAMRLPESHLVPMHLQLELLQRMASEGIDLPPLLRSLLKPIPKRANAQRTAAAAALRERLISLPDAERVSELQDLVRREVASVLGLAGPNAVDPDKELHKLGLDSLMAVELRNRLATHAGSALPSTLAFDYPTPSAIAKLLVQRMNLPRTDREVPRDQDHDTTLKWVLGRLSAKQLHEHGLLSQLIKLADKQGEPAQQGAGAEPEQAVDDMTLADVRKELQSKLDAFFEDET